jgi:glutathione S-transferase
MKLYFSPGACSLSPHIALREAGFVPDLIKVDLDSKKTASGEDYTAVNPNGYVPTLVLDDGTKLTEGPAIVQYIADRVPEKRLAPPNGTLERYRLQSLLNFIAAELHKSIGGLFNPSAGPAVKDFLLGIVRRRLTGAHALLDPGPYLMGEQFTVADGYLFTVLSWCKYVDVDLGPWPRFAPYMERVAARPAVREALKAEGF